MVMSSQENPYLLPPSPISVATPASQETPVPSSRASSTDMPSSMFTPDISFATM